MRDRGKLRLSVSTSVRALGASGSKPDDGLPADKGPLEAGTLVGDVVITPTPAA
jgi:hypothetical protein